MTRVRANPPLTLTPMAWVVVFTVLAVLLALAVFSLGAVPQ